MCRKLIYLVSFALAFVVAVPLCSAAVLPIDGCVAGDPNERPYILESITVGDYTVLAGELMTGTTSWITSDPNDPNVPLLIADANMDDFDINTMLQWSGRSGNFQIIFDELWYNTNGDAVDFILFEVGGNDGDDPAFAAIFEDGSLGAELRITPGDNLVPGWGPTGYIRNAADANDGVSTDDQVIAGIAFAITDLLDANGANLTNDAVIKGIMLVDRGGTDPSGFFAVVPLVPLAHLTFDDGTAVDVTGNGYDGLLLGTPPDPNDPNDPNIAAEIVEDPERGQVMQINGRGLQVDGPFDIRTSVSLTFWTKIDLPREGRFFSGGPWQFRTDNQSSSAHDWVEIRYPEGNFLNKADTRLGDPNSLGQLDGQWHHYAIVLNDAGDPKLYFDGVEAPLRDADKTRVHDFNGVDTIFFGTQDENGSNALQGCMDEIGIYNVALSADAITDIVLATTPVVGSLDGLPDVTVADGAVVSLRHAETEYVVANGDLVLGTTMRWYIDPVTGAETLWVEGYPAPAATVSGTSNPKETDVGSKADNFLFTLDGSYNLSSIDGIDFQETIFPSLTDTFFLFERGGNDAGTWQAILADGSLGAEVAFDKASSGGPYADTGVSASGQNAYGVVFTTNVPVMGVRITASGHDTLSISTIAAP